MAEIGFEKRDFRMVSYSALTIIRYAVKYVTCQQLQTSVLWLSLGCILHGPRLGVRPSMSQVQDTEGGVFSPAGTLPRGSVCSQVRGHV